MSMGTSTFVIRWINFLTMLVAVAVIGFGVWMSTHHDGCRKSLTLPVLALGGLIFVVSIVGFLGALKKNSILLWMYLIMLCLILVAILVFTVLARRRLFPSLAAPRSTNVRSNWRASLKTDEDDKFSGSDDDDEIGFRDFDGDDVSDSGLKEQSPIHSLNGDKGHANFVGHRRDVRVKVSDGVELDGPSDTDARTWNNNLDKNGVRVWLNQLGLGFVGIIQLSGDFAFKEAWFHLSDEYPINASARFIITNNGSGHSVSGLRYKEYQLQDYSSWFLKELNNTRNWKHLQTCLVKADDCSNLSKKYKSLKQYKFAKLTPIEAGCCRPPSECGYPAVNASYYDLSFHPVSSSKDCELYKNSKAVKCYNCDSCKAGVAQYMKTEWRVVAIFNVILFVVLSIIYFVGCCARRNAARSQSKS